MKYRTDWFSVAKYSSKGSKKVNWWVHSHAYHKYNKYFGSE